MTTKTGAAALRILFALAACGCSLPAGLGGDSIDRSSPLYGLRLVDQHQIGDTVKEPSDLAFDPSTGTFWTVSDQTGTVHRIAVDGAVAGKAVDVKGRDLEGVTLDPSTGHLFVVDEYDSTVFEATRDGEVVNHFTVDVKGGNYGIEGIACDPVTGGFVVIKERNPAEIAFVDRTGKVTSSFNVTTEDLSAVTLSPDGSSIFVVARFEEAVLELDRKGKRLNRLPLNVHGIEGLAFDDRGRLFVEADLGEKQRGIIYLFVRESQR